MRLGLLPLLGCSPQPRSCSYKSHSETDDDGGDDEEEKTMMTMMMNMMTNTTTRGYLLVISVRIRSGKAATRTKELSDV